MLPLSVVGCCGEWWGAELASTGMLESVVLCGVVLPCITGGRELLSDVAWREWMGLKAPGV